MQNFLRHVLQQPFGRRGGPANAHPVTVAEPFRPQFIRRADLPGSRIRPAAQVEQHLPIGAVAARHEHDHIVGAGELGELPVTRSDLPADGIVHPQLFRPGHPFQQPGTNRRIPRRALRGLREHLDGLAIRMPSPMASPAGRCSPPPGRRRPPGPPGPALRRGLSFRRSRSARQRFNRA